MNRLILSNTAAFIGPPDNWTNRVQAVQQNGLASIAPAVVARWLTPEFAASHPTVAAQLLAMVMATPDAGYTACCIAVRDADLRNDVGNITAPTLVISGTDDRLLVVVGYVASTAVDLAQAHVQLLVPQSMLCA